MSTQYIKIRGNTITLARQSCTSEKLEEEEEILNDETTPKASTMPSGFMNPRIRKQIRRIVYNWIDCIKPEHNGSINSYYSKPVFITLTLPSIQQHTDQDLHRKALGKFLIYMKRKGYCVNFLWRAERQKNGNLHYHILTDTYIDHKLIKDVWNDIMNNLGYIDQYKLNQLEKAGHLNLISNEVLNNIKDIHLLESHRKKLLEEIPMPNSTDIHHLKSIKNAAAYITKYLNKSTFADEVRNVNTLQNTSMINKDQADMMRAKLVTINKKEQIQGRVWGSSKALKNLQDCKIFNSQDVTDFLTDVQENHDPLIYSNEFVTIITVKGLTNIIKKHKLINVNYLRNIHINYMTLGLRDTRGHYVITPPERKFKFIFNEPDDLPF